MMQADEMKSIRKALGKTQDQFAADLGMSRKAINEMEAGKATIERRTEQAVRYLQVLAGSHTMYALSLKLDRAAKNEVTMDSDELEDAAEWLRQAANLPRDW